jgi:hypothetical protein
MGVVDKSRNVLICHLNPGVCAPIVLLMSRFCGIDVLKPMIAVLQRQIVQWCQRLGAIQHPSTNQLAEVANA